MSIACPFDGGVTNVTRGAIHCAHAASSDRSYDLVKTESLTARGRHRRQTSLSQTWPVKGRLTMKWIERNRCFSIRSLYPSHSRYHALSAASLIAGRRTEGPEQTLPLLTAYKGLSILL